MMLCIRSRRHIVVLVCVVLGACAVARAQSAGVEFYPSANNDPATVLAWPRLLDLNGDGLGDAFLYNKATGGRRFEVKNSTTGFTESINSWDPGWQIYPANLNRDQYTDFFLYDPTRGFWIQAVNHNGDGTFTY